MKIIFLHPFESKNLGDKVILEGTQRLLMRTFGNYDSSLCDLGQAIDDESYLDNFNWNEANLFVLSGTPWLWDKCHQSSKFHILEKILSFLPQSTRKIALGIGSCFPLATNVMEVYLYQKDDAGVYESTRQHTREKLTKIFSKFDFVFTRDILACRILRSVGVPAYHSICPAAFIETPDIIGPLIHTSFSDITPKRPARPLLVFTNPFDGVSRESCDQSFMEDFIQFQKWFKEEFNPIVVTMDSLDRDWCTGQVWDVTLLQSVSEFLKIANESSFVVSGRVHASLPAAALGKPSFILPVDTRYLAAVRLGVIPILTSSDLDWWGWSKYFEDPKSSVHVKNVIQSNLNFLIDKLQEIAI